MPANGRRDLIRRLRVNAVGRVTPENSVMSHSRMYIGRIGRPLVSCDVTALTVLSA